MRHIISILLQNEAGALARVAGMFSSRGYNIDSLTVAPTHDPVVSRLTLVTTGSDAGVDQIIKQTRKLIDVVEITNLSSADHLECELMMLKVQIREGSARSVVDCVRRHRGQILDESDSTRMVLMSGTGAEVDAFLAEVQKLASVLEMVRSGVAALARGAQVLAVPA
jgi:acetolactate synthase I/III small subunit